MASFLAAIARDSIRPATFWASRSTHLLSGVSLAGGFNDSKLLIIVLTDSERIVFLSMSTIRCWRIALQFADKVTSAPKVGGERRTRTRSRTHRREGESVVVTISNHSTKSVVRHNGGGGVEFMKYHQRTRTDAVSFPSLLCFSQKSAKERTIFEWTQTRDRFCVGYVLPSFFHTPSLFPAALLPFYPSPPSPHFPSLLCHSGKWAEILIKGEICVFGAGSAKGKRWRNQMVHPACRSLSFVLIWGT